MVLRSFFSSQSFLWGYTRPKVPYWQKTTISQWKKSLKWSFLIILPKKSTSVFSWSSETHHSNSDLLHHKHLLYLKTIENFKKLMEFQPPKWNSGISLSSSPCQLEDLSIRWFLQSVLSSLVFFLCSVLRSLHHSRLDKTNIINFADRFSLKCKMFKTEVELNPIVK